MKNLALIDLTTFNSDDDIRDFVNRNLNRHTKEAFLWNPETDDNSIEHYIIVLKSWKNNGYRKIWMDVETSDILAYETKNGCNLTNEYLAFLQNIKPITVNETFVPNKPNRKKTTNFDLDSILDKISKYTIHSLTDEEKEFLDKYNK